MTCVFKHTNNRLITTFFQYKYRCCMEKRQNGKWNWFEYTLENPLQFILFVSLCSLPLLKQSKCQSLCECSYWVKPTRSSGMPVSWRMVLKFWDPFLSRCVPSFSTTSPKCSRSKRPHRRTSWVVICTNRKKHHKRKICVPTKSDQVFPYICLFIPRCHYHI